MGGTQLWAGPAEFGWVASGSGGGPRSLGGWHGARGFGWVARSSGVRGSQSLDGRHAAEELGARMEFGWVTGPQSLDGCEEQGELGARGVWTGGTRLWSRTPAVFMRVPSTFNIDGLFAGWVTACTHTC